MIALDSHARVLIVAPHPDDESIATGGLIQQALAAGARVRVLFATDGDNNPWPQRALESRWRIGPAERVRWATRRRGEALAALRVLGLEDSAARFLHLPDQGITSILMRGGEPVLVPLEEEFTLWRPNVVVGPSGEDLHPDHSALQVLIGLALPAGLRRYDFVVHGAQDRGPRCEALVLSEAERKRKLAAIECHRTQLHLSRKRFSSYARREEWYRECAGVAWPAEAPAPPIWRLAVPLPPRWRGRRLLLAGSNESGEPFRWSLPLPARSGLVHPRDERTGTYQRAVALRLSRTHLELALPRSLVHPAWPLCARINARGLFFDRAGWRCMAPPPAAPHEPAGGSLLSLVHSLSAHG